MEQLTKIHIINDLWSYQLEANYQGTAALGAKAKFWSHIHPRVVVSISGAQNLNSFPLTKEQVKLNLKYFHHLPKF